MDLWFEHEGRRFYRVVVRNGGDFAVSLGGRTYAGLFWSHLSLDEVRQRSLANAIVESGCRYVVCAGRESEALHDKIDGAYIRLIVERRPEGVDRELVMTTWHDGEPPEDVAFFLTHSVFREGGGTFDDFLIVHVGGSTKEQEVLDQAIRHQVFDDPAV